MSCAQAHLVDPLRCANKTSETENNHWPFTAHYAYNMMIRSIQVEVTNVFRSKPIRKVRCQIGLLPHMAPLWPAYSMRHGPFLARLVFSNEKACSSHSAKNLSQFGQPASEVQIISSIKRSIILSPGRARRHCNRSNTDRRRDRTGEGEHYKAISRPRRCLCSMNSENHF